MKKIILLMFVLLCVPCFGAEFLIYDKLHWMDKLTPEQLKEKEQAKNWAERYAYRYKAGDVVEVHADGFYTGPKARGYSKTAFRLIHIPGMSLEAAKPYMQEIDGVRKRRYSISSGLGSKLDVKASINDLVIEDKVVTIAKEKELYFIARMFVLLAVIS